MPKKQQQAVMAELAVMAAIADVSGRRVGVSRDALVRLVSPEKRTDEQVADALEEEDHHFLFSALLTDAERATVHNELSKGNPSIAKEDPASRAVMELAYEHWSKWNKDRQNKMAAITPKTAGVFRQLLDRIRSMLPFFDRVPTVTAKGAAQVWESLGEARKRTASTGSTTKADESPDANAVLMPKGESLRGEDLRKQWGKATGERAVPGKSWDTLTRESDAKDRAKGREVKHDAYSVVQAMNDILPSGERETRAQWEADATEILADSWKVADIKKRMAMGEGLTPAEEVAMIRLTSQQLSEAATSGNANRYKEVFETVLLRKKAGSRVGRELVSRKMHMTTADGRRDMILNYTAEMGKRWQNAFDKATNKAQRNKITDNWVAQQKKIHKTIKEKFNVDLTDPRIGSIFSDAYSVDRLLNEVSVAAGERFSLGHLVGYYTAGNLLTGASFVVNITGYPSMASIAALKGVTQIMARSILKQQANRELISPASAMAGAKAGFAAIGRGLTNGFLAFKTGRPQADLQARRFTPDHADISKSRSPIKNPFVRVAVAPFLETNRFVDEMFWTIAYNGALASNAVQLKATGDKRTHEDIISDPDADTVDRAAAFADWMTLRGGEKNSFERGVAAIRSPAAFADAVDKMWPGAGKWTVNPLYFTMPFYNAIARLFVESAQITPYGMIAHTALAAKRGVAASRADEQDTANKLSAKSINNIAYLLGGIGLMGLGLLKSGPGDDDYLVKGSPDLYKSPGERAIRESVEKPRTIGGLDYSRLDPLALPLSLHADFRIFVKELIAGKDTTKALSKLGEKAFTAAIDRQFLQGISGLYKPEYDEDGNAKGVLQKFSENTLSMLPPGRPWISTYRKLSETEKMSRPKGVFDKAYDAGTPTINAMGETSKTLDGSVSDALSGLIFTPRGESSEKAQKIERKIYDINEAAKKAGANTWYPGLPMRKFQLNGKTHTLTDEQYDQVKRDTGTKFVEFMLRAPQLDSDKMTPERKIDIMQKLRDRAHEIAMNKMRADGKAKTP